MSRANIFVLASFLALATAGCSRNGAMAALVGLEIVSATAQVAGAVVSAEQERAIAEQAARDRARHEAALARYEAALEAYEARQRGAAAAPPGLPPGSVIIVEPPPPPPME